MTATTPIESLRETFASASDVTERAILALAGEVVDWEPTPPGGAILAREADDGTTEFCFLMAPIPLGPYETWKEVEVAWLQFQMSIRTFGWKSVDDMLRSFEEAAEQAPPGQTAWATMFRLDVLKYTGRLTRRELVQALRHPDDAARKHAYRLLEEFDQEKMEQTPRADRAGRGRTALT